MNDFLGKSGNRTLVQVKLTEPIARDIKDFSLFPSEAEILLPPNVCLKKIGAFPAGHGLEIIQLEQTTTVDPLMEFSNFLPPIKTDKKSPSKSPAPIKTAQSNDVHVHPLAGKWRPCRADEWTHAAPGKHRDRARNPSSFMSFDHDGSGRWVIGEWYGSHMLSGGAGPRWEGSYKSEHAFGDSGGFSVELLPDGRIRHQVGHWKALSFYERVTPAPDTAASVKAVRHRLTGTWRPTRHSEWYSKAPGKHRDRASDSRSFLSYTPDGIGEWRIGGWFGTSMVCQGPGPKWEGNYRCEHFGGDSGKFSYELLSDGTLKVTVAYWKTVEYWRFEK